VSTPPKKSSDPHYGFGCCLVGILLPFIGLVVLAVLLTSGSEATSRPAPGPGGPRPAYHNPISKLLETPEPATHREGVAAAILLDTSGSMKNPVRDADGSARPKLDIARRAMLEVLKQFDAYAQAHPGLEARVGIYEFSGRPKRHACRPVVLLSRPDLKTAEPLLQQMIPDGNTPIGDAMIEAKRDLDATGVSRLHLLVITDGENNQGYAPGDVTLALAQQPAEKRAAVYFIAFDIAKDKFQAVMDAGGMVLGASNGQELKQTLDSILTGKILVEQPEPPKR
jgi:hypothetical protein